MGIELAGIRMNTLSITRKDDTGAYEVTGTYSLMGSNGVSLATQTFNGYNDSKIDGSPATIKLVRDTIKAYTEDITTILGLGE